MARRLISAELRQLRRRVLTVCRELVAAGVYPSARAVRDRVPGLNEQRFLALREEFLATGLLVMNAGSLDRQPAYGGVLGATAEERRGIRERYLEIRAAKLAEDLAREPKLIAGDERVYRYHGPRSEVQGD